MKIRETAFNSASERTLYKALDTKWGDRFNLFPSLPFANIIDIEGAGLTEKERKFLFATSVDFTLCEKGSDKPMLSIEFDGLGHGFSRRGEYIQFMPAKDPYRKLKLDLKLRIAWNVAYPFFVVSYQESLPDWQLDLTIVDGIIGQVLAHKHFVESINGMSQEELEEQIRILSSMDQAFYPEWSRDRYGYIQDVITMKEIESETLWDPIVQEIAITKGELWGKNILKSFSSQFFLKDPSAPVPRDLFDFETIKKRFEAFAHADWIGCVYTIDTSFGRVERTAWVRNIEGFGVSPLTMAENIAELLAVKEVQQKASLGKR